MSLHKGWRILVTLALVVSAIYTIPAILSYGILPLWVPLAMSILAVIYLIWPLDIIPDVIPGLGITDDLFVIMLAAASWAMYFGTKFVYDVIHDPMRLTIAVITILAVVMIWRKLSNAKKGGGQRYTL